MNCCPITDHLPDTPNFPWFAGEAQLVPHGIPGSLDAVPWILPFQDTKQLYNSGRKREVFPAAEQLRLASREWDLEEADTSLHLDVAMNCGKHKLGFRFHHHIESWFVILNLLSSSGILNLSTYGKLSLKQTMVNKLQLVVLSERGHRLHIKPADYSAY